MEPALASLLFRPGVPRDRQGLKTPVGKLDEILLKWLDSEGVLDLEVVGSTIGAIRPNEELAVLLEEAARRSGVGEPGAAEIALHALGARGRHRCLVLRPSPFGKLRTVTRSAGVRAYIASGWCIVWCVGCGPHAREQYADQGQDDNHTSADHERQRLPPSRRSLRL